MKILNVTPYCISNYGAMLQAWALRRVLEGMGHTVFYLKYDKYWPGRFGFRRLLRSKSMTSIRMKLAINRQMDAVRDEIGEWNETRPYSCASELMAHPPEADCYLVGSDQVFGIDRMMCMDTACHAILAFGNEKLPRIAYAASFGRPTWSESEIAMAEWAAPHLRRFAAIGLRESSGIEVLRKWAGVEGRWTPDPTLLLSAADYREHFRIGSAGKTKPRVFTYMLGFNNGQVRNALYEKVLSKVSGRFEGSVEVVESKQFQTLSYWISNIANADCVVTNSFHGICFSILFNRPFVPLGFEGGDAWRNARAQDVLAHFGLSSRFVTADNNCDVDAVLSKDCNWMEINHLRRNFAKVGRDFLLTALSGCEGEAR